MSDCYFILWFACALFVVVSCIIEASCSVCVYFSFLSFNRIREKKSMRSFWEYIFVILNVMCVRSFCYFFYTFFFLHLKIKEAYVFRLVLWVWLFSFFFSSIVPDEPKARASESARFFIVHIFSLHFFFSTSLKINYKRKRHDKFTESKIPGVYEFLFFLFLPLVDESRLFICSPLFYRQFFLYFMFISKLYLQKKYPHAQEIRIFSIWHVYNQKNL